MSEEVREARTAVPRALSASVAINGLLGFGMVIAVLYTIGNIADTLDPSTGFVFINYFATALNSNNFATGLTSLLLVLFMFCSVAVLASTSRVTWAFARDNGLPGSSWIKKVSTGSHLPFYSIALSGVISMLLGLINIGSTVAFNAIVSLVVAAFFGSYAIPITLLAYRRATHYPLELGPWNMGRWGLPINIVALCWLAMTWTFSFFPTALPVTAESMNWSIALWGGIMSIGLVWYFAIQRRKFSGPIVSQGSLNVY